MIPYTLIRSRRRSIALVVSADAVLTVRAPLSVSISYIDALVHKKESWISKTMERMMARPRIKRREFVPGETFLFLGDQYTLTVSAAAKSSLVLTDHFVLKADKQSQAHEIFTRWYRKEAKKIIAKQVSHYADMFVLHYRSVKISSARKRWGSCSARDNLNFSWRLVMAPMWIIDYVVIHELAHTVHKNHSRAFWKRVEEMYPEYKKAECWLKDNQHMLVV
jgi:predicted metal-dependent hydrolase